MSFLADALWHDLKYGVLARSREAYDECARLHAAGDVDGVVRVATDAFGAREDNFKDALEHVWGHVKGNASRKELDAHLGGRRDDLMEWLFAAVVADAPDLANSRFFLEPAFPDRAWVQRGNAWDLAWRHDGEWRLRSLKEVRAAGVSPLETLLVLRVAGKERPNPRLPA